MTENSPSRYQDIYSEIKEVLLLSRNQAYLELERGFCFMARQKRMRYEKIEAQEDSEN